MIATEKSISKMKTENNTESLQLCACITISKIKVNMSQLYWKCLCCLAGGIAISTLSK